MPRKGQFKPRLDLVCLQCGRHFNSRYPASNKHKPEQFCSGPCHLDYIRTKQEKPCANCGKLFVSKSAQNACCSYACQHNLKKITHYEGDCVVCGTHFTSKNLTINYLKDHPEMTPRCCSRSCMYEWRKSTRVTITCKQCGEPRTVRPSAFKYGNPEYCSKKCSAKNLSLNYSGENNHHWKGDRATNRR